MDGNTGKSSQKSAVLAKEKFNCPLIVTDEGVLAKITHRPAVKVVAITDEHLAKAILSVVDSEAQFKFYSGGNN